MLESQSILETQTSRSRRKKRVKAPLCSKTECFLFSSTLSPGVTASELLQYFMCCSNSSREACVATACTMIHPTLYTHDDSAAQLLTCEILYLNLKENGLCLYITFGFTNSYTHSYSASMCSTFSMRRVQYLAHDTSSCGLGNTGIEPPTLVTGLTPQSQPPPQSISSAEKITDAL